MNEEQLKQWLKDHLKISIKNHQDSYTDSIEVRLHLVGIGDDFDRPTDDNVIDFAYVTVNYHE